VTSDWSSACSSQTPRTDRRDWHTGIALAALIVVLIAPHDAFAQTALRKAGCGLAAMTTGFLEIPGGNMTRKR